MHAYFSFIIIFGVMILHANLGSTNSTEMAAVWARHVLAFHNVVSSYWNNNTHLKY